MTDGQPPCSLATDYPNFCQSALSGLVSFKAFAFFSFLVAFLVATVFSSPVWLAGDVRIFIGKVRANVHGIGSQPMSFGMWEMLWEVLMCLRFRSGTMLNKSATR